MHASLLAPNPVFPTRDADETKDWMDEKELTLQSDDFGHDLATVQRLQRKHEGTERDLAALGEKVKELDETANRLMQTHPDQAQSIYEHQKEINDRWNLLTQKVGVDGWQRVHNLVEGLINEYRYDPKW